MEPVQGQDAALLRVDPVELPIVPALRHRKDAKRVGPEQEVRGDAKHGFRSQKPEVRSQNVEASF